MSLLPARIVDRATKADLDWVVSAVFPTSAGVTVSVNPAKPGPAAQRWHVMPSADNPLVLVKARSSRLAARMLTGHWRLHTNGNRLLRAYTAFEAFRPGAGDTLAVTPPAGDRAAALLTEHVGREVSVDGAVITLGRRDPNRKPTVELFGADGRPACYVKVGWNTSTRRLAEHEYEVLGRVSHALDSVPGLRCISPIGLDHWNGRALLKSAPIPIGARRWSGEPPSVDLTRAVAAAVSSPERMSLDGLALWDRLERGLHAHRTGDAAAPTSSVDALLGVVRSARARAGNERVHVAGCHGDWAPWNVARLGSQTWIWDLEHADNGVPLGFDALNWQFQVMSTVKGLTTDEVVPRLRAASPAILSPYDVSPASARIVLAQFLVWLWLRSAHLNQDGSGWKASIEPGIPDALVSAGF
jgi:hypothetical protein